MNGAEARLSYLKLLLSKKINLIAIAVSAVDTGGMNINIWHKGREIEVNIDHARSTFVSMDTSNRAISKGWGKELRCWWGMRTSVERTIYQLNARFGDLIREWIGAVQRSSVQGLT